MTIFKLDHVFHGIHFSKGHPTIDHQEIAGEGFQSGRNTARRVQHHQLWCQFEALREVVAKSPAQKESGLLGGNLVWILEILDMDVVGILTHNKLGH